MKWFLAGVAATAFLSAMANCAHACSVCMGRQTGPLAEAANGAIFVMLGCLGCVIGAIAAAGFSLYRRSCRSVPDHVMLIASVKDL